MISSIRTIIIGLGNPILGDDGVGWRVVQELGRLGVASIPGLELDCMATGGFDLMERLAGYHQAIIIDVFQSESGQVGKIRRTSLDELPEGEDSAHGVSLKKAVEVGEKIGIQLPSEIIIYAMEVTPSWELSEGLSPRITAQLPTLVQAVLNEIKK